MNYIGTGAFQGCSSLTSIQIPFTVKNINNLVFAYCSKLISVTFENTSNWKIYNHLGEDTMVLVNNPVENAKNLKAFLETDSNNWGYTGINCN